MISTGAESAVVVSTTFDGSRRENAHPPWWREGGEGGGSGWLRENHGSLLFAVKEL